MAIWSDLYRLEITWPGLATSLATLYLCSPVDLYDPSLCRLRGRAGVLQRPAQPHRGHVAEPRPRLRGGSAHCPSLLLRRRASQGDRRQPLDRGRRRGPEGPPPETGLQRRHVAQLPAALCLHHRHQGLVPVTALHRVLTFPQPLNPKPFV